MIWPNRDAEWGKLAAERGREHEALVLRVLDKGPLPTWATSFRSATTEEDARGVDVVVSTSDAGDLLLQVKSSQTGAAKFKRRYPHRDDIGLIVIRNGDLRISTLLCELGKLRNLAKTRRTCKFVRLVFAETVTEVWP